MWKKLMFFCFIFLLIGCSNKVETINKANGESKTYLFFKNFDVNHYYVSFFDRNTSSNDDTKIIMARDGDKLYYEFDGYERSIIIQKEGIRYNVVPNRLGYFKSDSEIEDFSIGILPNDIDELKTKSYKTGNEKVFNSKYTFERYDFDSGETTYYFKGKKLIYVRYKSIQKEVFLRFNFMKNDFDSKIFEIDSNFEEITY